MWKSFNLVFTALVLLLVSSCKVETKSDYTNSPDGYYYRLIAYQPSKTGAVKKELLQLAMSFLTQQDSVFWDTHNNFNDLYVVSASAYDHSLAVNTLAAKSAIHDSFEVLLPVVDFFEQYFKKKTVPEFCKRDTIVKIRVKLKRYLSETEYRTELEHLQSREEEAIQSFFASEAEFAAAKDSAGFFWVQRPSPWSPGLKYNNFDRLMVHYEGYFLSGRMFEKTASDFELIYGVPDQLVKGLNYVMGRLNEGQTAKIILPSALAFGESGSSNGTVPPYTPVLYNIKLKEVKRK